METTELIAFLSDYMFGLRMEIEENSKTSIKLRTMSTDTVSTAYKVPSLDNTFVFIRHKDTTFTSMLLDLRPEWTSGHISMCNYLEFFGYVEPTLTAQSQSMINSILLKSKTMRVISYNKHNRERVLELLSLILWEELLALGRECRVEYTDRTVSLNFPSNCPEWSNDLGIFSSLLVNYPIKTDYSLVKDVTITVFKD